MQECIDHCRSCEEICLESVTHCLQKGREHAQPDHVSLLLACAEICSTSARFMLLGSEHHVRTCEVCAEVCDACAADCETMSDDDLMRRCAEISSMRAVVPRDGEHWRAGLEDEGGGLFRLGTFAPGVSQ